MWLVGGVVRRYIDIFIILLIPTPLVISLFLQLHPYFFVHLKNVFSFLFMLFLCNIANVPQRTFEIVQKSRSRGHGDIIILTRTYVDYACKSQTATCKVLRDVSRKLQLTLCSIMAS